MIDDKKAERRSLNRRNMYHVPRQEGYNLVALEGVAQAAEETTSYTAIAV